MLYLRSWLLAGAAAALFCGAGCKKSGGKSDPTTFTLTGAQEVIGALDRKDYEATIRSLAEVKASVSEEPQREEYRRLLQKVKDSMVAAMSTNESAIRAYQVLRFMRGR